MKNTLMKRANERLRRGWLWQKWILTRQARFFGKHPLTSETAIVFLVPGYDVVGGGVMAILAHAVESVRQRRTHGGDVYVCTMPGHPPLMRLTRFKNDHTIIDLRLILTGAKHLRRLHINIPEVHLDEFIGHGLPLLADAGVVMCSFNIMLQNVDFSPSAASIARLKAEGDVTITTAHKAYAKFGGDELLGCRAWQWSVWISPEQYSRRNYEQKENIIIVSPDAHPERARVIATLKSALPEYQVIVIQNMRYGDYKKLIARAKVSVTFGEGLDGYFVEPIFSGAIGCAVYNDRFFTDNYRSVPCVYESFEALEAVLPGLVRTLDEGGFEAIWLRQFKVVAADYSYGIYEDNMRKYYADNFTAK